ncbi:putative O-glycosylation ligase, exosortase A system-associated [Scleromatobacter humisilvae]|uniref:O-glycosylation ligase, exosortase A system-associated n=1 Tax=Scleromatobacter humisilvae TaxID=2897159 RepID=A0A9X2BZ71_9BURK|nr:putative O-glycosylation ligase, exosortase A system-associated [Scleromatobacter humisilvae]MCK9686358.1 putative O-glycosylation ligase, exosortase A system-associated [Scleromatobacter humisilvae]
MRDVILLGIVVAALPFACRHTWIGVLLWTWISIMNPHKLAWGFAMSMPFAAMAAGATVVSLFITKDKVRLPSHPAIVALILLTLWMVVTTVFAIHPDESWIDLKRTFKIQAMTLVAAAALRERRHIELFIWVNALSLAFYGFKGGLFTILTGGGQRVWGPPGGFIEGNNEVGLALVMVIPMMNYLRAVATRRWVRISLTVLMLFTAVAVLGTQSRGAFLAISAMGLVLWMRSKEKAKAAIVIGLIGLVLTQFMPASWDERMQTIGTYNQDSSAMGRINAWQMTTHLANDRFLGGGFFIYTNELFARYAPVPDDVHAAHSIYFQVLGEHGYVGLILFLSIGFFTFRTASRIRREAQRREDAGWLYHLSGMMQVSMVGYAVGGAFLSLAYFDLPYNVMVIIVASERWLHDKEASKESRGAFGSAGPVAKLAQRPRGSPTS